jgi:hypothetical protein
LSVVNSWSNVVGGRNLMAMVRRSVSWFAGVCGWNATTGQRLAGWNMATAYLPLGRVNASEITAVRYGWGEDPCCPGADRTVTACPPNSCPLQVRVFGRHRSMLLFREKSFGRDLTTFVVHCRGTRAGCRRCRSWHGSALVAFATGTAFTTRPCEWALRS